MQRDNAFEQNSPLIVEVAGLAGAGKTTLAHALSQRNENIVVAADIALRNRDHFSLFIGQMPSLLPVFLRRTQPGRWFTWDEIKAMVYLKGWSRVLRQQAMQSGAAILLDHGPIFKLATLNAFGPEQLRSKGFEKWWNNMFEEWASTLDFVIWLDTSDTNLRERINTRAQRHAIKGKAKQEASEFLARYRTSYEQILAGLTAYSGPMLIEFDTSRASTEQIVDEVLVQLRVNKPTIR